MELKGIVKKYDTLENYILALEEENEYLRYKIKEYQYKDDCLTKDQLIGVMSKIGKWGRMEIDCYDKDGGTTEVVHNMDELKEFIKSVYHESRKGTPDEDVFKIKWMEVEE